MMADDDESHKDAGENCRCNDRDEEPRLNRLRLGLVLRRCFFMIGSLRSVTLRSAHPAGWDDTQGGLAAQAPYLLIPPSTKADRLRCADGRFKYMSQARRAWIGIIMAKKIQSNMCMGRPSS